MNRKTIILSVCLIANLLASTVDAQIKPKSNQPVNRKNTNSSQPFFDALTYGDTSLKMVAKEISYDMPAEKGATIQVTNTICNLDIRPWNEEKVMIVTTVTIEEKLAATLKTNEELLEAGGISVKSFGNRVDIQARGMPRFESPGENLGSYYNNSSPIGSRDQPPTPTTSELLSPFTVQDREYWSVTGKSTKTMIIFVPQGSKLDIDNKNTAILINANIGTARFKMTRSNLDARNFKNLTLQANYYNINISDVEEAQLELENGTLTAGVINSLDLDSEGSEIEYESGNYMYMRSHSDRITIDEIAKVEGRKLYGELRLGKLITSLDIEGTNADIKIRNILPVVEKVRVTNKYGDLRLPVKNLTNFTLTFYGENSSVFASFQKIPVPVDPAEKTADKAKTNSPGNSQTVSKTTDWFASLDEYERALSLLTRYNTLTGTHNLVGEKAPLKFTAAAGDTTGKHTRFEIVCHQCSVDFK